MENNENKKKNYDEMLDIVYKLVEDNCPSVEIFKNNCSKDCDKCREEHRNDH